MTQPSLLDLPEPVQKPNPVKVERDRLNAAAARVLAYLKLHGDATNVQLCCPDVGGMRAVGRIHELRRAGHAITKQHVTGGLWRYTLEAPHDVQS